MRARAHRGTRVLDGRYYILSGRGTKQDCQLQAAQQRKHWRYVRIVPAHRLSRLLDDYMIYVFERLDPDPGI